MGENENKQDVVQNPQEGTVPATGQNQTQVPNLEKGSNPASVKIVRTLTTTIIALAVLVFAGYLFKIGQAGIGGTLAGVVIAHYFSGVQNTGTTSQVADVMKEFTRAVSAITSPDR